MSIEPEENYSLFDKASIDADEIAAMTKKLESVPHKWPLALANILDLLCAFYEKRGDSKVTAGVKAREVVLLLGRYMGGREFYLPSTGNLKRALRDHEIWLRMGKEEPAQLAIEYGITTVRVYQIRAEQQALRMKRAQPELF